MRDTSIAKTQPRSGVGCRITTGEPVPVERTACSWGDGRVPCRGGRLEGSVVRGGWDYECMIYLLRGLSKIYNVTVITITNLLILTFQI